jgi:hypothetical protein
MPMLATTAYAQTPGDTELNPVICTNFAQLKAAMEDPAILFVQLNNVSLEALPPALTPNNPAIQQQGDKTLILNGNAEFYVQLGVGNLAASLIHVGSGSALNVKGDGKLTVRFASKQRALLVFFTPALDYALHVAPWFVVSAAGGFLAVPNYGADNAV